ncbi:MAG TPA: hypothetical protein VFK02_00935 [Kofleriaceae bacterium]|nr:hypothetical protein [Kofleriaceae bacterium]
MTAADLRKVALDVPGVQNAWIELAGQRRDSVYYHPRDRTLSLDPAPPSEQVMLRGLHSIVLDPAEGAEHNDLISRATLHLHRRRGLCEDFAQIKLLRSQQIQVNAWVEIGSIDDLTELEGAIVQKIIEVISPPVPFTTLDEGLRSGMPLEAILEGPSLAHGFLTGDALEQATRRTAVNTSDIIRAIRDVPGVQAVSRVRIGTETPDEAWSLDIMDDCVAELDRDRSSITLRRGGKVVGSCNGNVPHSSSRPAGLLAGGVARPVGRDRHVHRYTSVQRELPAIYGIGELGLPDSASPERKARANQLRAYLMFFDQIMANHLAQLAHVKDLLSHDAAEPNDAAEARTYFSQTVEPPGPAADAIRLGRADQDILVASLDAGRRASAGSSLDVERKNRFLNHLLARFAETVDDHGTSTAAALANQKRALLKDYARLGGGRGAASSYVELAGDEIALVQRIVLKLGLTEDERPLAIEHILLRPMLGDELHEVPLIAAPLRKDPYSLQLTFALPEAAGRFAGSAPGSADFCALVEHTIREETPAHLTAYVRWMSEKDWGDLQAAHDTWRRQWKAYWAEVLGTASTGAQDAITAPRQLYVRAARDRIIDLLGIGETYPLQDVSVGTQLIVSFSQKTKFYIEPGQNDVRYELYDQGKPVGDCQVVGTGIKTELPGPPVTADKTFDIRAIKLTPPGHACFLEQVARVKVGINTELRAHFSPDLACLNPNHTADGDPRIVDHGATARVWIEDCQAEARYEAVCSGPGGEIVTRSVSSASGGALFIDVGPVEEDMTIQIRATRTSDPPRTAWLTGKLLLAVRADPTVPVAFDGSPLVDPGPPAKTAKVTIAPGQASVTYQAYARPLDDRDFAAGRLMTEPALVVSVPASLDVEPHDVRVPPPGKPIVLQPPYVLRAEASGGSGGDRTLELSLCEDSLIVIQAYKEHFPGTTSAGHSELPLDNVLVALARPEAANLVLTLTPDPDGERGHLLVQGGQQGVFYRFRVDPGAKPLGLPAYFHRRDPDEEHPELPEHNHGIGLLEIERDFAIARDRGQAAPNPEFAYPPDPIVDVEPLPPLPDQVSVMAVSSRTGVGWESSQVFSVGKP